MHIEIVTATPEQEPVLANLLELYIHDFSEYVDLDIGPDGRFGYGGLSLYWSEPDRHALLVRVDGKLAGFVLVKRGPGATSAWAVWDMAEFFIIRRWRRRGVGTNIAHEVWRRFPGQWEVRVMQANPPARQFWTRTISGFIGKAVKPVRVEKGDECWWVFSFESTSGE